MIQLKIDPQVSRYHVSVLSYFDPLTRRDENIQTDDVRLTKVMLNKRGIFDIQQYTIDINISCSNHSNS